MSLTSPTPFHLAIATTVSSRPVANGLLIFTCSLPPVLLERYYYFYYQSQEKACRSHGHQGRYPLWLSLFLLTSAALELPFIFALHPVTTSYPINPIGLPPPEQLALQVLIFFFVEGLCRGLVWRWVVPVAARIQYEQEGMTADEDDDDDTATVAVMDFSLPRLALILGVAVMSLLGLERVHPLSVAGWVIMSTLARCRGS
ncbi:hypothetical protein BDV06DRAFT_228469 [Aspergillus oleicola]